MSPTPFTPTTIDAQDLAVVALGIHATNMVQAGTSDVGRSLAGLTDAALVAGWVQSSADRDIAAMPEMVRCSLYRVAGAVNSCAKDELASLEAEQRRGMLAPEDDFRGRAAGRISVAERILQVLAQRV